MPKKSALGAWRRLRASVNAEKFGIGSLVEAACSVNAEKIDIGSPAEAARRHPDRMRFGVRAPGP